MDDWYQTFRGRPPSPASPGTGGQVPPVTSTPTGGWRRVPGTGWVKL